MEVPPLMIKGAISSSHPPMSASETCRKKREVGREGGREK